MLEEPFPSRQLLANPYQAWLTACELVRLPERTSRGESALMLGVSVLLAVLADLLFNGAALGINLALWLLALSGAVVFFAARRPAGIERRQLLLLGLALGFSLLVALRASPALQAFDLLAVMGLLALAIGLPPRTSLGRIGPLAPLLALAASLVALTLSVFHLILSLRWDEKLSERVKEDGIAVGRALLLATPVFLVFCGLFVAADAVFASKVSSLFILDLPDIRLHVVILVGSLWVSLAAIWSAAVAEVPCDLHADMPDQRRLKPIETGILLVPLALLFAAFVLVQLRYLFGGDDAVLSSVDLTYSQYARRGFFELVVASGLLLPVLLAVNWARKQDRSSTLLFRVAAVVLVGLLLVVMASAWERLSIYMDALGLTVLRFYAAVVLSWLLLACLWFLVCLVGPMRQFFLSGVALAAVVVLVAVNVINPDRLIADTNTSRLEAGRTFDAEYAAGLSADAVPVLVDHLDRLSAADRCIVATELVAQYADQDDDPRSFNLGRYRAEKTVEENRSALDAAC